MKLIKAILFIFLLTPIVSLNAQESDVIVETLEEKEDLFSSKDKDFLQMWFYEQVLEMNLTADQKEAYYTNLLYYTYKMSKLGLRKYGYTDEELKMKFDEQVEKLNNEMKEFLTEEQIIMHVSNFGNIVDKVYAKKNWTK